MNVHELCDRTCHGSPVYLVNLLVTDLQVMTSVQACDREYDRYSVHKQHNMYYRVGPGEAHTILSSRLACTAAELCHSWVRSIFPKPFRQVQGCLRIGRVGSIKVKTRLSLMLVSGS